MKKFLLTLRFNSNLTIFTIPSSLHGFKGISASWRWKYRTRSLESRRRIVNPIVVPKNRLQNTVLNKLSLFKSNT